MVVVVFRLLVLVLTYNGDDGGGRGRELRFSECGDGGDGFCKGGYLFVLGVLLLSLCCFMMVVVLVGL